MGGQNNSPLRITIYNKPEEILRNQNNLNASDIDDSVIERLIAQSALFCIQICDYIPLEIIAFLNDKLFSARKDVEFRIFGFYCRQVKNVRAAGNIKTPAKLYKKQAGVLISV